MTLKPINGASGVIAVRSSSLPDLTVPHLLQQLLLVFPKSFQSLFFKANSRQQSCSASPKYDRLVAHHGIKANPETPQRVEVLLSSWRCGCCWWFF